ncbi:MAG: VanW family protein [Candidatus Saganbacteria bacterium]|nr:VanW family protein [Candidatus Saganbacteria bacterium]
MSKYTTYYGSHDSPNRISNIKLIASLIDSYILLSGGTFSLLSLIGDFSAERGFKEAFVIVGDELVPQHGGGTCQIATTLFNAVALAALEITQRKNHSIWFNIYPLGRDATVYPKVSDFKFTNNTGAPVLVKAKATGRSLTFEILGTPFGKKASFTSPYIEGKIGSGPFKTRVIRKIKEGDKVIKEEEFWSYYKQAGDKQNVKIRRPEPR